MHSAHSHPFLHTHSAHAPTDKDAARAAAAAAAAAADATTTSDAADLLAGPCRPFASLSTTPAAAPALDPRRRSTRLWYVHGPASHHSGCAHLPSLANPSRACDHHSQSPSPPTWGDPWCRAAQSICPRPSWWRCSRRRIRHWSTRSTPLPKPPQVGVFEGFLFVKRLRSLLLLSHTPHSFCMPHTQPPTLATKSTPGPS